MVRMWARRFTGAANGADGNIDDGNLPVVNVVVVQVDSAGFGSHWQFDQDVVSFNDFTCLNVDGNPPLSVDYIIGPSVHFTHGVAMDAQVGTWNIDTRHGRMVFANGGQAFGNGAITP